MDIVQIESPLFKIIRANHHPLHTAELSCSYIEPEKL